MRIKIKKLLSNGLVIGSIVLPTMLCGAVLWQDRITVLEQKTTKTETIVRMFSENARQEFETNALIGNLVRQNVRAMNWDQISQSAALHEYLYNLALGYPQTTSIWLIDPQGMLRASSLMFPAPPISDNDRDYFIALRERDTGVFIGKTVHGKVVQSIIYNVAQRRLSTNNEFDGVVVVSANASRFMRYWTSINHDHSSTILVREDGAILARYPPVDTNTTLRADAPLMQRIAAHGSSGFFRAISTIDGQERLYAYEKVGDYPIYVGHGLDMDEVWRTWYGHVYAYGCFFALGAAALLILALVAVCRLDHWRDKAADLVEDITKREEAITQQQQAQKLEALGQIAGQIAHDFGNILSVIVGSFDMLEVSPATRKFLKLGQDAAERGIKTMQSLLAIARRQPQSIEMFDLNAVLIGMTYLIRQVTGATIKLSIEPASSACWIKADRNQTELAILNIVGNARDAMPDGGDLTITTRHDDKPPNGLSGEFVVLTIADTGTGIPPDIIARVFDPFYTTKPSGRGSGIGLSMVRNFVHASNGTVSIDSTPQGTTITLWLPIG